MHVPVVTISALSKLRDKTSGFWGNSRSISRIADVSINTVTKLLVDAGNACSDYQDKAFRNLTCKKLQADEIWSFAYAKEKNVPEDKRGHFGYGDIWTFTAICADTKLVPSWYVGRRDAVDATTFLKDLATRLSNRVQLTTDGHNMYLVAVEDAFGKDVDYSMLVKWTLKVRNAIALQNALAKKNTASKGIPAWKRYQIVTWSARTLPCG